MRECWIYRTPEMRSTSLLLYIEQVQSVIELLDGYIDKNWDGLQTNLKEQYWQNDTQKNTPVALNQLIRDASILDLSVYVLKYTSITKIFIKNMNRNIMIIY